MNYALLVLAAETPQPNHDIVIAALSLLGIGITALFSYLAAKYNAKQATKATTETADTAAATSNRQVDVDEWKQLVSSLQAEVKRLGDRVGELEKKGDANRARIETLEEDARHADTKYHMALTYIRDMVAWTRALLKSKGFEDVPPAPPEQIANDLAQT